MLSMRNKWGPYLAKLLLPFFCFIASTIHWYLDCLLYVYYQNDYGYDSCKSDVTLFVMVIELPPRPTT